MHLALDKLVQNVTTTDDDDNDDNIDDGNSDKKHNNNDGDDDDDDDQHEDNDDDKNDNDDDDSDESKYVLHPHVEVKLGQPGDNMHLTLPTYSALCPVRETHVLPRLLSYSVPILRLKDASLSVFNPDKAFLRDTQHTK